MYDYIFKGWSQPLLGTFIVPIGELLHKFADERRAEMEQSNVIIQKLAALIDGAEAERNRREAEEKKRKEEQKKKEEESLRKKQQNLPAEEAKSGSEMLSEIATERTVDEEQKAEERKPRLSTVNITGKLRERVISNKKDEASKKIKADIKKKKKAEAKRVKDLESLEQNNRYVGKNLVMPIYKYDDRLKIYREEFVPPDT